jgi:surface protein
MNVNINSPFSLFARDDLFLRCRLISPCRNGKRLMQDKVQLQQALFDYLDVPTKPHPNCWDVSQVTNFDQLLSGLSFDEPIGDWDTSAVTSMEKMFENAVTFNQNIGDWDTARVTSLNGMFENAVAFNQNIGDWDTARVTDMSRTFHGATSFNQNIGWDTSIVTSMAYMFNGATAFNQDLSNWDTGAVTDMYEMFKNAAAFNQDMCRWKGLAAAADQTEMFTGTSCPQADTPSGNFFCRECI